MIKTRKKISHFQINEIFLLSFIILLIPIVFWASQYPLLTISKGKEVQKPQLKLQQSSTLSQSKLGVFYIGATSGGEKIVRAGPRVIKVMDIQQIPPLLNLVRLYKQLYPQGIVVWRVYNTESYGLSDSPEEAANRFFNTILQPAINQLSPDDRKLVDYLGGTNGSEQTPYVNTDEGAKWFNRYWVKLAENISNAGFRPNMGEIYVGNLDPATIEYLISALRKLKETNGSWSYHGYTLDVSKDISTEINYSLRYRQFYDYLSKNYPDLADIPMILGEGGIDKDGNPNTSGWKARVDAAAYRDWLIWYDEELKKDPQVLGVALFQIGGPGWPSFELEPISDWLANYLGGKPAENQPLPTNPVSIPKPSAFSINIPTYIPTPIKVIPSPISTVTPTVILPPAIIPTNTPPITIIYVTPTIVIPTSTPTPSPTPTIAPIIDIPKTINRAKSTLTVIMTSIKTFLLTILP